MKLGVQYDSLERQHTTVRFGMWIFLASESLLFAGLIALFAAYRIVYPAEFHAAAAHANVAIGSINTFVLITSSFTVALATKKYTIPLLALTIALGVTFEVLKLIEYAQHLGDGIAPGNYYSYDALPAHGAVLYFTLYYALTGLHALHVLGGLCALSWLLVAALRGRDIQFGLELGGLYWHLVDLMWIFLWPLLYLAT